MEFDKIKKNVVAPSHYCGKSGIQVIDYVDSLNVKIIFKNNDKDIFLKVDDNIYHSQGRLITIYSYIFNMIKYLFRAGKKDNTVQEYAKIVEYCKKLVIELNKIECIHVEMSSNKYDIDFISEDYDFSNFKKDILANMLNGDFNYVLEVINREILYK